MMIIGVHFQGHAQLVQVILTGSGAAVAFGKGERREQKGCQEADNADYNEQFNQGKTGATVPSNSFPWIEFLASHTFFRTV